MNEQRYDVHGVGLAFKTNHAAVAETIHARLQHFERAVDDTELRFELVVGGADRVEVPSGRARRVYEPVEGEVAYYPDADALYVEHRDARLLCSPAIGASQAFAPAAADADLWLLSRPFLTLPLIESLKRRGLYSLHAAAGSIDGGGILVAGTSGAGKTTLTLALGAAGFALLSDDMVFLSGDGALTARAFPDEVDVTDDTLGMFPELSERAYERPGWPKKQLPIDAVGPVAMSCRPALLVLAQLGRERTSRLEPIGADAALVELSPNVLLTEAGSSQRHLAALGELVRSTRCYALELGRDVLELPERLRALLEQREG